MEKPFNSGPDQSLSKREMRCGATAKEMLAVVFAIDYFRFYSLGGEFVLRTDHQPLVFRRKPKTLSTSLHKGINTAAL